MHPIGLRLRLSSDPRTGVAAIPDAQIQALERRRRLEQQQRSMATNEGRSDATPATGPRF
ncbi:hypothetical protein EP7_003873 [Isosphaeraceae bacterium EP7]